MISRGKADDLPMICSDCAAEHMRRERKSKVRQAIKSKNWTILSSSQTFDLWFEKEENSATTAKSK